jgi:DNA primase
MISTDTIDTIVQTVRIEEVVGDFVQLRRRGVNMLGLCPFHNEKTPSFTVSPAKGIYKCFGCGKAGNSVNFIMEHEHFTYPEALRYLAKKYSIEIDEEQRTPEQLLEMSEKESLYNLSAFAQQYFTNTLHETPEGKSVGLSYFRERGIRDDIIKKFQLGYSPNRRDAFSAHAATNGYKKEYLIKTGLSIERENHLFDRFHGRVIFPIHTASGRVIGFGGRIMQTDKALAKYVNSPESDIYNKSKTLYGIYFAKSAIISKDNCLLVEGYTDVISLHQAGIENVVASSGTSLTIDQIRMIKRYTSNISILYDGDPAGIKASFRGIDMIVEQEINVRIVLFPDGEDPDSFARKHHPDEVAAFIDKNSENFIAFKTRLLLAETQGDPIKKAALIREIVTTISLITDSISRSLYLKECSAIMDIREATLIDEMNKILRKKNQKPHEETPGVMEAVPETPPATEPQIEIDPFSSEYQEKELIKLLLIYGNEIIYIKPDQIKEEVPVRISDFVTHRLTEEQPDFDRPVLGSIFQEYSELLENSDEIDSNHFLNHNNREISLTAVDIVFTPYQLSPNWRANNILITTERERLNNHTDWLLAAFRSRKMERRLDQLQKQLSESPPNEPDMILLHQINELKKQLRHLYKILGRVVVR